jgi:hypothetical protein
MSIASCWPTTRLCSDVLHVQQPLDLVLRDARHRDAGPHRDDLGDLLLVDLGASPAMVACHSARSVSTFSRSAASSSRSLRRIRSPGS